jgi:methanogenic corrinoid protein MtbC1
VYTIKEAALRAGIGVPLLRAWERRYGVVRPTRTPAGYRLYDDAAIDRVRAMRQLVEEGWTASQAAQHIAAGGVPARINDASDRTTFGPELASGDVDFGHALVESAAALDMATIEALLDDAFASGSFERVVDDRLMPALNALGDAWARGDVSVAGEHAASYAVLRRLSAAFEAAGPGSTAHQPVLVGLPAGSRHEIGALAFATALRRRGIGAIYLGADIPLESWLEAARRTGGRAVVIGIPTSADVSRAKAVAQALLEVEGLVVAVGGPGASMAGRWPSVVVLPDGIARSADALETSLGTPRSHSSG